MVICDGPPLKKLLIIFSGFTTMCRVCRGHDNLNALHKVGDKDTSSSSAVFGWPRKKSNAQRRVVVSEDVPRKSKCCFGCHHGNL